MKTKVQASLDFRVCSHSSAEKAASQVDRRATRERVWGRLSAVTREHVSKIIGDLENGSRLQISLMYMF